jgi:hypothetical protein
MTTFLLSSPSYFQQATRADVTCDGETNSALTLLITSGAGDDHRGVGSRRLNDPMICSSQNQKKDAKRPSGTIALEPLGAPPFTSFPARDVPLSDNLITLIPRICYCRSRTLGRLRRAWLSNS